jgi:hypothetical protein
VLGRGHLHFGAQKTAVAKNGSVALGFVMTTPKMLDVKHLPNNDLRFLNCGGRTNHRRFNRFQVQWLRP